MSIRVRHYTRRSARDRILHQERIVARDPNKVFVERANRQPLSPRAAERPRRIERGKGNAFIEFDADEAELKSRRNRIYGDWELYLEGDIDLTDRNPVGCDNV